MSQIENPYPVQFSVDYPEGPLDRLSSFLRVIWIIPIAIILAAVSGESAGMGFSGLAAGGALFVGVGLMILFRQKYPRWWFDWNLGISRFSNRVFVYMALLRDEYPSTDEEQAVHLEIPFPDVENDLIRWYPLVKWFLAIPHYIILFFLWIGLVIAVIIAWFSIMISGTYPRSLFDFVVGVLRWSNRVGAYAFLLVTDKYPPFRLGA